MKTYCLYHSHTIKLLLGLLLGQCTACAACTACTACAACAVLVLYAADHIRVWLPFFHFSWREKLSDPHSRVFPHNPLHRCRHLLTFTTGHSNYRSTLVRDYVIVAKPGPCWVTRVAEAAAWRYSFFCLQLLSSEHLLPPLMPMQQLLLLPLFSCRLQYASQSLT